MAAEGTTAVVSLTAEQTRALFDILTHHETYAEIEGFKAPDAVTKYGFPFTGTMGASLQTGGSSKSTTPVGTPRVRTPVPPSSSEAKEKKNAADEGEDGEEDEEEGESMSPLLQMLLTRLILPFPGVRDLPREFWSVRMQGLFVRFAEAGLSESYDKGAMGTRKTLATGASSVGEMLARGVLGGVERTAVKQENEASKDKRKMLMGEYDKDKAEELERAWEDVVQGWAYGDLLDEMFDHLSRTDDVEAHSPAVKAAVDYGIIHLATFAHHIFILSPEGQYLLKLLENINGLIPYKMIKQTLRIGNAATMISGMMRLLLAKLSVTSITNWFGLTANADDGMNLLQRIISLVLSWDATEFRKSADKFEKSKEDKPTEEMLQAIQKHIAEGRSEHGVVRTASAENSQSVITAILNVSNPELVSSLTEAQHAQCLEYYSALLSVHDRDAITSVLCKQPPDLFTQSIKDIIAAYDPMIRSVHSRIDLREYLESMQGFISDFIHASKPKISPTGSGEEERMVSVEDYVELLRKNRGLLYGWVHALASKCPDVWEEFRVWAKDVAVKFQRRDESPGNEGHEKEEGTNGMSECLDALFASLDPVVRAPVLAAINAHASYLADLRALSQKRLQCIITSTSSSAESTDCKSTTPGPGVYLSRWQDLLDETLITPSSAHGSVRHGRDVKHITTMGKLGLGGKRLGVEREEQDKGHREPDVSVVVEALGEKFRDAVRERTVRRDG